MLLLLPTLQALLPYWIFLPDSCTVRSRPPSRAMWSTQLYTGEMGLLEPDSGDSADQVNQLIMEAEQVGG